MRRSGNGVGGYRGRRTLRDVLVLVAAVLAVVVVVVVGGLLIGQRYIVYTDDGLRLDVPFFSRSEREELPDPGNVSFVEQPGASSAPEPPVTQVPDGTDETAEHMRALELPLEALLNGTAAQQLEEAGADALILEMKNAQGSLGWQSEQGLAVTAEVNGSGEMTDAIRAWNEGEVYTIARVCCFRDNAVPYHRNAVALRASYGNWRDELGLRWLDPASGDAQAYVAALCGELAALGFDEILLECGTFPYRGNLETLTADNSARAKDLIQGETGFLAQVCRAVEPYGAAVSLWVDQTVVNGEVNGCGLDAQGLERYAHRLWAEEGALGAFPVDLLTGAGITRADERFVEVASAWNDEENVHQARTIGS